MNIRCRGPNGQFTLSGIDPAASFVSLRTLIAEKTGIAVERQELLAGFPPKLLQASADTTISEAGIAGGDTLVVGELPAAASDAPLPPTGQADDVIVVDDDEDAQLARALSASVQGAKQPGFSRQRPAETSNPGKGYSTSVALPDGSMVTRRVIASDNSCLFNAVGYVMERSRRCSQRLRKVIADAVAKDPEMYSEGFLGKSNAEYQQWILDSQKWGGAIELSILARFYAREIAAYDIQTKRVDIYGQEDCFCERVMLIYDGLHYDALAQAAFDGAPEELDVTIFERSTSALSAVEQAAAELVDKAHRARQYTDTANFTLRCGVCYIGVRGEKEAVEHAQQTGHQNFSEYH